MILPGKSLHRPRMTLGQILATVAVSALPIAMVMRTTREGDLAAASVLCLVLTLFFEVVFWYAIVPMFPGLRRTLGRPSWFAWEVEVDPDGIEWVDDRREGPARGDGIHWVE